LFDPATHISAILEATSEFGHIIGQVNHPTNCKTARFSYLLADGTLPGDGLEAVVDFLSYHAGETQVINLLAEVEENSPVFEGLRRCGFSAYGIAAIWQLPAITEPQPAIWKQPSPADEIKMRTLYQNVTPPLEQAAEPYQPNGGVYLAYRQKDELAAWARVHSGPLGTYLVPVIDPLSSDALSLLRGLAGCNKTPGRPLYLQVRSHQSWLNTALEELGAQTSASYVLMTKHLAASQKVSVESRVRHGTEVRQAKPTVPILHNLASDTTPTESKNGLK